MTANASAVRVDEEPQRRGHERLIAYWQELAGERKFPEETDIDTQAIADLWNSCFLLNVENSSEQGFKYEFMGPSLIEAYGADLTGKQHNEKTDPNIAAILKAFAEVTAKGEQMIDESEFTNAAAQNVKYRCCLVPFGSAPDNVKYILGLMRWKFENPA